MTDTRRFTAWGIGLLAVVLGLVVIWGLPLQFATARSDDLQTQVKDLTGRVQELEAKLACLSKDGDNVIFEKCNVYIRNGSGKTDGEVNGLGNLIIGYNETGSVNIKRTGSHNVVLGPEHAYTSFGGLVAGRENTISAPYASVTGGRLNTASGLAASVSGGSVNTASKDFTSVSGGKSNEAKGLNASISGGSGNMASGNYTSISGGKRRDAVEQDSWRGGSLLEQN